MSVKSETLVRAIEFPIAEPIGMEWKEFRTLMQDCWRRSTTLANWSMSEQVKAERIRRPEDKKLWKRPTLDLYHLAFLDRKFWGASEWEGGKQAANAVIRFVQKVWAKRRYNVLWIGSESVPRFRYPMPFPVHNQGWEPYFDDGNRPHIRIKLAGDNRTILRLKGGPEFRRQLAGFRQLVEGCKCGEASIRRRPDGKIMVKLIGHFPAPEKKEGHYAVLRTDSEHFWVVESDRPLKPVNADDIKRQIIAHRKFLQRIADDTKYEKRWPAAKRKNTNKAREDRCIKHRNRIDTWIHQASAMFVGFCQRQGIAEVLYDDECQDFMPSFPWHQLKTKLAYKLEDAGILMQTAPERSVSCGQPETSTV